jgi:hypothetical protein
MNWYYILLVFALVLCVLQAFLTWLSPNPPRPIPHLGWLGIACFIASFLVRHSP